MKYFFIFTKGGISDVFKQIWISYNYCKKYNRILVINTKHSYELQDDIRKYILFNDPIIFMGDITELYGSIKNESFYPCEIDYENVIVDTVKKDGKVMYMYKNINLDIDLDKDYDETVLICSSPIGGSDMVSVFKNLVSGFSPMLLQSFYERYSSIPPDYISVHVRNTDYSSNVGDFINENKNNFKDKNIFLATDSFQTLTEFKNKFGSRIYSFSDLTVNKDSNKALHFSERKNIPQFITDIFCDLLLSCYGNEYYYSSKQSNYSKNILELRYNIDILNKLTSLNKTFNFTPQPYKIETYSGSKYLLLIPQAGFTDKMEQIWLGYKYCKKYGRILIIDTRFTIQLNDDIRKYIIFNDDIIFMGDIDQLIDSLKDESFYPIKIGLEDLRNVNEFSDTSNGYDYKNTNMTINLEKDYDETVIVHSMCGTNNNNNTPILNIFQNINLKISNNILNILHQRYGSIPYEYISVHVRNTDYSSNVEDFIKENENNFKDKNIFLATDSFQTLTTFKNKFGSKIYSFSDLLENKDNNKPLHNLQKKNTELFITDIICDMLLLSYGIKYYYSLEISGFSRTVEELAKNIDIINKITGLIPRTPAPEKYVVSTSNNITVKGSPIPTIRSVEKFSMDLKTNMNIQSIICIIFFVIIAVLVMLNIFGIL